MAANAPSSSPLPPNKRLLANDGNGHDQSSASAEFVSKDDCIFIADEAVRKQAASVEGLMQKSLAVFSQGMQEQALEDKRAIREQVESVGTRVSSLEDLAQRQLETNARVSKDIQSLQERQGVLENQLRMANQSAITREDLRNDNFDRPPNLEIIRVNVTRYAAKRAVHDALGPWLAEIGITDEQWILVGNEPQGKRFHIRFQINPLSAARLVQTALANLKDSSGNYRTISCKLANNQMEKLHIGPDESEKVRTKRRMAACVKKAVGELYPKLPNVHYKFFKEAIYTEETGICFLAPTSSQVERDMFLWNNASLPGLGINKATLLDKTMQFSQRADTDVEWSL